MREHNYKARRILELREQGREKETKGKRIVNKEKVLQKRKKGKGTGNRDWEQGNGNNNNEIVKANREKRRKEKRTWNRIKESYLLEKIKYRFSSSISSS